LTGTGGSIEVRTRNDKAGQVVIEVADDGAGIAPELQPKIFDAFEQGGRAVTSKYGGLGLGLAISKRVIDLHGGTISVDSPGEGQGATFTVKLKAMQTSLLEGPVHHLPFDARQTLRASILLVEDHQDTANVLRRVLERAGYDVAHAAHITKAEELAAQQRFDLVISDVGLPDGSGLDLMSRLRKNYGLTGIALSGFGMDEDREASKKAGFSEHFTKPVDAERLRNAIEKLVATNLVESR
jgi:CheY-like chemotaxis protein